MPASQKNHDKAKNRSLFPRIGLGGFTLAELLIVVAIIAVLISIAIPVFSEQLEKARETVDLHNMRNIYSEVLLALNDGTINPPETTAVLPGGKKAYLTYSYNKTGDRCLLRVYVPDIHFIQKDFSKWSLSRIEINGIPISGNHPDSDTQIMCFTILVNSDYSSRLLNFSTWSSFAELNI